MDADSVKKADNKNCLALKYWLLEDRVKKFNAIQHVHVGKLIPSSFKKVKDYPVHLESKTVAEILNGKGKAYNTMRKLLQQQDRLGMKNFGQ